MQTLSSARCTCRESASAWEWTETVLMPISLQARITRMAISPRLAMRILLNMFSFAKNYSAASVRWTAPVRLNKPLTWIDDQEGLVELDGLAVLHQDLHDL